MPLFTDTRRLLAAAATTAAVAGAAASPAAANPDLLVAPTRVVLDNQRGGEVILNNIGATPATYRVSLELRRMNAEGQLEEVDLASADPREQAALAMISYAPRRVTLAPDQPQAIRIGIRPPAGLADGEYRAHMLFQGIPDVDAVTDAPEPGGGFSIALTPVYGVSIPIIVRQGRLKAAAAIGAVRVVEADGRPALSVDLARSGDRSIYGRLQVRAPGQAEPVFAVNGVAIYGELDGRTVTVPISDEAAAALHGPVTVDYLESRDGDFVQLASTSVTLP